MSIAAGVAIARQEAQSRLGSILYSIGASVFFFFVLWLAFRYSFA
jgi:hypothetical protein